MFGMYVHTSGVRERWLKFLCYLVGVDVLDGADNVVITLGVPYKQGKGD